MSENSWNANIFFPATGVGESSGGTPSSSSSSSLAGSSNEARQNLLFSQVPYNFNTQTHPPKGRGVRRSRRRACDNCVRRRSRCDGEIPCNACILHDTGSTCQRQCSDPIATIAKNDHSSIFCRACQNCWSRKSKCDRTYPCSKCIVRGQQDSCYQEKVAERDALQQIQQTTTSKSTITEQTQISKRACYNCWIRKNKCSKQKPCNSCVFHGCADSCFVELDENSKQGEQLRQKMDTKRRIRAKAKAIAHSRTNERKEVANTQHDSDSNSVSQQPSKKQCEAPFKALTRLAMMPDLERAISLAGNPDLANDWPSIDKEAIRSILTKIRNGIAPEAVESAYIYALLAVCAIALPTLHPFKATGQILEKNNIFLFKHEALDLMSFVSDPNDMGSSTPTPLLECRVFHALAWICMYSQQAREAHYFSEQSILSARLANIIHGFSDADELYSKEEVQQRDVSRAIVLEISSLAEWINFSSGIPTSMPRLAEDVKRFAMSAIRENNDLTSLWRAWKVYSITLMGNALRHQREIQRRNDDGTDVLTIEEKDRKAIKLIERMTEEEKEIDDSTRLLSDKLSALEITKNLDDVKIARRQNANFAAQYSTYLTRNMIAARSLESGSMNIQLSGVALDAAFRLMNDLPEIMALQHTQHQFPPLKHFLANLYEAGMQTTFRAINRLKDIQMDHNLTKQMSSLLFIVPRTYTLMNQFGVAGPFAFAVQSACTAVPVQRPLAMINNGIQTGFISHTPNNEWQAQQVQQQSISTQTMWNPFASSSHTVILPINQFEQSHQWNEEGSNNLLL